MIVILGLTVAVLAVALAWAAARGLKEAARPHTEVYIGELVEDLEQLSQLARYADRLRVEFHCGRILWSAERSHEDIPYALGNVYGGEKLRDAPERVYDLRQMVEALKRAAEVESTVLWVDCGCGVTHIVAGPHQLAVRREDA